MQARNYPSGNGQNKKMKTLLFTRKFKSLDHHNRMFGERVELTINMVRLSMVTFRNGALHDVSRPRLQRLPMVLEHLSQLGFVAA